MLGGLVDSVFGCHHKKTTFPLTPVDEFGKPKGGTYVVCLDCGKQFHYDWERMRTGGQADIASQPVNSQLEPRKMPFAKKRTLKYALLASAVPAAWIIGKAITSRRSRRATERAETGNADTE
jgi:hypothetical protein